MLSAKNFAVARPTRSASLVCRAQSWQKLTSQAELKAAGGKKVIEVGGSKILVTSIDGEVYAVSNKCSHLGLPLVGKTAMFQAEIKDKCVICPAHKTAFDLKTGQVKGEWCPSFPSLPVVGKMSSATPLPTYQARVDEAGNVEVLC